jgi:hypothetical protein
MKTSFLLERKLKDLSSQGILEERFENNNYLKLSYKGTNKTIPSKWNIKIYRSGNIVCVDNKIVKDILNNTLNITDANLKVLQIDDAGWGFPLLGVMIGITDGEIVITDIVDVLYFQGTSFTNKEYLNNYSFKGQNIVKNIFKATPKTHRIEICTGYVNHKLKENLRCDGFDVRVTEIKGLLQDELEKLFKQYVHKTLNKDISYDPKELLSKKKNISNQYYSVLNWAIANKPHLLKHGWKSIKKLNLQITV